MKKRYFALGLVVLMLATLLAACGGGDTSSSTPPASTPDSSTSTPDSSAPPATDAVYDAAYNYFATFPSDNNVIKAADLFTMMDNEDEMFILDIRRPDDYAAGHLIGAVNLSFFDMSIAENLDKLPDDRPIMVYCYTGQTASQVTALLNIAGKVAKNVQSGFNNAISKEENYETYIETTENALPGDTYAVDAAISTAISGYFSEKMAKDGTAFANFNIAPESVKEIVDNMDDSYVILSVRRADDYAAGHIPGAINIPYGQGMEAELANLPTDKTIIVYCYSGQTSSQTTAVLRMMGYDAYSMSGGMGSPDGGGWLGAGYETVTD
ncbi:rhodanese-like domain-containing protein [Ruminococcaceae bacterium OttesenSCG-928-O06]|nr:rhodanese-like domain-containing protein [Ruminococcaceae bacterium OttesenSCG-928-O06]